MSYYDRALEMKDELVANRRYLHENAEVGLTLPKTRAFIEEKLREYGIGTGALRRGRDRLIGKGGKVLLLRCGYGRIGYAGGEWTSLCFQGSEGSALLRS